MNRLEELQLEATDQGIEFVEWEFSGRIHGLYCDCHIALDERLTTTELVGIMAEELGHHYTTVGDITDQSDWLNRKQERLARMWAYRKLVPFSKILEAHTRGCCNRYEMAKYLEVTESFLQEAIAYYGEILG